MVKIFLDKYKTYSGLAALLFGLLIYACLPVGIVPLDDDFGYLRSVVLTIQHGRPWTDDWLEPWAAGFSGLSALLYSVTNNFYCATNGLLALLSVLSFFFCFSLVRKRGIQMSWAIIATGICLTFPSVLWKIVQFTGMALYIPCLLAAIWAAQQRRWWVFLVAWGLAISTRQSAITWIALPVCSAIAVGWEQRSLSVSRAVAQPLGVAVAGAACFLALVVGMNKTHAQRIMTDRVFEHVSLEHAWRVGLLGIGIFLTMAGIGLLMLRLARPSTPRERLMRNPAHLAGLAFLAAIVCSFDLHALVGWENPSASGLAVPIYLKGLVVLGAIGWSFTGGILCPIMAISAFASITLVCLRGAIWDYYFFDIIAFSFFGVNLRRGVAVELTATWNGWHRFKMAMGVTMVIAGATNSLLLLDLKAYIDRSFAVCVLSEKAIREARLDPAEISYTPFGYQGWHLYPHFIRNEGKDAYIGGFDCYLRRGAVEVGQGYSRVLHMLPQFRHEPPADRQNLIAYGATRFLWAFRAEYFLLRFKSPLDAPAQVALPAHYVLQKFPINEVEWHDHISGMQMGR